jgi:uncharacterized membrane protein
MTGSVNRLEQTIGIVLRTGVATSSVCLAAGLLLSVAGEERAAGLLLQAGIVILLATPVVRVVVSFVEYVIERDWMFVTLTAIVLFELIAGAVAALILNRRV